MRSNEKKEPLVAENYPNEIDREELSLENVKELLFEGKRWFDLVRLARKFC